MADRTVVDRDSRLAVVWKNNGDGTYTPYVNIGAAANAALVSIDGKLPALSGGKLPVVSAPPFASRSDSFAATGNGTTIDASASPLKQFSIAVKGTGAGATTWDVRLEGSLDGVNWTQLIQHTNTDNDGTVKGQLAGIAVPVLYLRSRCAGVTLGSASAIVATILGV